MITVLIDKNPILRKGLNILLTEHFDNELILESDSISTFHQQYTNVLPNLIILGLGDPLPSNNLETLRLARKWYGLGLTVVYAKIPDARMLKQFFKFGIHGCLTRNTRIPEFLKCVSQVLSGNRFIGSDLEELILSTIFLEAKNSP